MKLAAYCLVAALVGTLVWCALLVFPLSRDALQAPGERSFVVRWPHELAALAFASIATALVFRPVIRRMERPWHYLIVSALYVLAGSVAAGFLLVALRWTFDRDAIGDVIMLAVFFAYAGLVGLAIGVAFLPIGIPIALGGTLALRRIAGRIRGG